MDDLIWEKIDNKDGFYITATVITASTAGNFGVIFTALHPCEIMRAYESHTTAGTDAGAVTLNLEKLTSGEALDAGDSVLTTGWNLKSTANTPVEKTSLDLVKANRQLSTGDRLALEDSGVLTALVGVQVTVYFKRLGKGGYK